MSNNRYRCDNIVNTMYNAQNVYNDFAQLTQSYQAHGGTVNTGTTPQVQYSYADGSSNTIRITGMTYPNGRNVVDDYGTAGGMNDAASRIFGMKDSGASTNLVEYSYLGLSGFVRTVYPESDAQYTMIGTTSGTNPDSGDIYLGLDRFGRVIDSHWANVAGTATLARVKYGYNRVSSRTWRDNLSPGMTGYDELYGYDQLQRLQTLGRGTLNGSQTAITSPTFGQDWTLDETGNWNGFKQDNTGSGTWNLDQTRTANTVNEITSLVNETSKAWTTPAYDKAGNMTRIPVPGTLPDGVAWNTMSLSDWDNLKLADWDEMTLDNVEGVYDAWNRLVRLHVGETTLAEYAYDARGYRIRKDSYTDGTLTEARHYYYTPGWQVVEERVGTSNSADRQLVWGLRYIDDLVLRDRDSDGNGTLDERRYCLQDGNWNTIALTNPFSIVTERFSYDAYGVPTFLNGSGSVQASSASRFETLYAGYRWDSDTSRMYYVRNRLLLPYVGTWNRRDPLGYVRSKSLTQYVDSQPFTLVDGLGLQPVPTPGSAVDDLWKRLSSQSENRRSQHIGRSPWDRSPFDSTTTQSISDRARNGTLGNGAGPSGESYCIPKVHNGIIGRGGGPGWNNKSLPPLLPGVDVVVLGHYDRNRFNYSPANQQDAADLGWIRQNAKRARYHQNGLLSPSNVKYQSPDGHQEAVFDANGQLVTDAANTGTYNYGASGHGWSGEIHHGISDVLPYYVFGNSPDDPTPLLDRIIGPGTDPGLVAREISQAMERTAALDSQARCSGIDRFISQPASAGSQTLRAGDWRRSGFGF